MSDEILHIPIDLLDDHPDNATIFGFDEVSLSDLTASIREIGVLQPLLVEEKSGGRYMIIAGHRRKYASKLAGRGTAPCVVKRDEVDANLAFTESNLNFRELSPMQKARAIRHQKKALGITPGGDRKSGGLPSKFTRQTLIEKFNLSNTSLHYYDKLNDLLPELQSLVDNGAWSVKAGARFAELPPEEQKILYEFLGDSMREMGAEEVRRLREQNDRGYLVLEVMQKKINELEAELNKRREKDGDIEDLDRRISSMRSKKKTLEYDLVDCQIAVGKVRERVMKNGAALLYLVEELARPVAAAKPKIELLLETPPDQPSATHLLKWAQTLTEIGRMVETAAKKSLMTVVKNKTNEVDN